MRALTRKPLTNIISFLFEKLYGTARDFLFINLPSFGAYGWNSGNRYDCEMLLSDDRNVQPCFSAREGEDESYLLV